MDFFNYREQQLYAEDLPVTMLAEQFGTPSYVYSRATIERHWHAFNDAMGDHPHLVCYAVKASANLALLNVLARLGSGFDIVSGGELARVLEAGGDPAKVVFSGVGKTHEEIEYALEAGIACFNVESVAELHRIDAIAKRLNKQAPVSIRVNPDVDAKTHPYISTGLKENKFGIAYEQAFEIFTVAARCEHLVVRGVDCHIGSQLTEMQPFLDALDRILLLIDRLEAQGIAIAHLDVGGGLGVTYFDEKPPHPSHYVDLLRQRLERRPTLKLLLEPGRAIMANAGILLTRVEYIKENQGKLFAVVNAAMNDLLRPSLYGAWQDIVPVVQQPMKPIQCFDVVGPVCETGDFLGKQRELAISEGDLLAVRSAGAYGFSMASNYNARCRPAEILVDGADAYEIRRRETWADLWKGESLLP